MNHLKHNWPALLAYAIGITIIFYVLVLPYNPDWPSSILRGVIIGILAYFCTRK